MKLLTYQQMAQKYDELNKNHSEPPFFYKIQKGDQLFYYVGFEHTYDPLDPQFTKLKQLWDDFLAKIDPKKALVLVEGGERTPQATAKDSIKHGGEAELTTLLAHQHKIKCLSPEPGEEQEIKELLKQFPREGTMYYYFARIANQWLRAGKPFGLREYLESTGMRTYRQMTNWPDFQLSLEDFIKIHDKLHDHPFSEDDQECFYQDSNPNFNPISAACSEIRDEYMVKEVIKLWKEGKSLFIVYGSGHAIRQEPALKEILT